MKQAMNRPLVGVLVAVALLCSLLLPAALPAQAAAGIGITSKPVPQGASVPVTGAGFSPNDAIVVYVDATVHGARQRIEVTTASNGSGVFATRLNLPAGIDPGTYRVVAQDTRGISASQQLTVWVRLVIRVGGSAFVTVVDRDGYFVDVLGMANGESVQIQATFPTYSGNDIVETRTTNANSQGNVFNVGMYAPAGARMGWATVTATGASSKKSAQGRLYVAYRPSIFLTKSSIMPGDTIVVNGRGFVANSQVKIQIGITDNNGNGQTLSATGQTNGNGAFYTQLRLPGNTRPGTYTVTATGTLTGIQRTTQLTVTAHPATATPKPTAKPAPKPTATPRPTATPKPTAVPAHASANMVPNVTLPNQNVTMVGYHFPANTNVTVGVVVNLRTGGNRSIAKTITTDNSGDFAVAFRVPYKTAAGTYTVTASGGGVQASSNLQVLPRTSHPKSLGFQWISLWYHTVRQGTWDELEIQAKPHTELGIWVHIIFPSGAHLDYYQNTDGNGSWAKRFSIPGNAASSRSNQAYITVQLWHGSKTTQAFMDFTLV